MWLIKCIGLMLLCHEFGPSLTNGMLASQCCEEPNIITEGDCQSTSIYLTCESKYMLDPSTSDNDVFQINGDGELVMGEQMGSPVKRTNYCLTNYKSGNKTARSVAIICFESTESYYYLYFVKGTLALISVLFILVTLYVYYILPDLRETQDKVTCITISCLATFLLTLGIVQTMPKLVHIPDVCQSLGYIVYFSVTAYFTWLNLVMLNVWKCTVCPHWKIKERHWLSLNHLYGWTVPLTLSFLLCIADHLPGGLKPDIGRESCWIREHKEQWIFVYIPISISLFINLILFVWTSYSLHRHETNISADRKKALAYKISLYLKLLLLAGLTWVFEIFSFHYDNSGNSWYWLSMDIINSLHGVLIFFVLIVWRRRVRRELAGRQIFLCCYAPERWSDIRHPEEEQLNIDGSNELSNIK